MDLELIEHVRRAQAGDLDAFCYVATATRPLAVSMARSIVADAHEAEDAAQAALLLAHARLGELREPAAFAGWLRALVRTCALRAQRRRRAVLGEEHLASQPSEGEGLPSQVLEASEARAEVRAAVQRLHPRRQAVVEGYYLRGLSLRETANELGLPEGTVKRLLHEARERLRPGLVGLAGELGFRPPAAPRAADPLFPARSLRLPL